MSKTLLPQEGRVLLIARLSDGTEYRIGEVSQYKVSETRETRLVECLGSNPPFRIEPDPVARKLLITGLCSRG